MPPGPKSSPSELQIALDNRAFEIQLFWQRSNYFLVLMTALGVGVFAVKEPFFAVLISFFATVSSWYWYRTNLGSKFWQESWEVEVVRLANQMHIASFERSTLDIVRQVKDSLDASWTPGGKSRIRNFIDDRIIEKPSVSYYMILLSLTSTLIWALVTVTYAARSASDIYIEHNRASKKMEKIALERELGQVTLQSPVKRQGNREKSRSANIASESATPPTSLPSN